MKRCPNCGREADEDQMFCANCGSRLEEISQADDREEIELLNRQIREKEEKIGKLEQEIGQKDAKVRAAEKHNKRKNGILAVVFLVCAGLFAFSAYEWNQADYYESSYRSESRKYNSLNKDYTTVEKQVKFMDKYIAIINSKSDDQLYHTYNCSTLDWSGKWSIVAYNTKTAENKGYKPCPKCH